MFDVLKIPERISNKIKGLEWNCDNIGKSDSTVILFEKMVLKIEKTSRRSKHEIKLLDWLDRKLPVPKIIEAETQDDYRFLLMSKMFGEMPCTGNSLKNMEDTVTALANCIKRMWKIDITNCPCRNTISERLIQAKYNIENNLIDVNTFEPETFSVDGFSDMYELYNYLNLNRPKEDLVFSHGDFSFPNIFVVDNEITGLIDWGYGGISDRWEDISECYRVLRKRYSKYGLYSESEYLKYKELFFKELDLEPDEEKIHYLNLLREFS